MRGLIGKFRDFTGECKFGILAFILAFVLAFGFISLNLQRRFMLNQIKQFVLILEHNLHTAGYDLAYEDLNFSSLYPYALASAQNFQIYKKDAADFISWKIDQIKINSGFFSPKKITFDFSAPQKLQIKAKEYSIVPGNSAMDLNFDANGLNSIILEAENIYIKDFAEIKDFSFGARKTMPQAIYESSPFFDGHLRIHHVKLNGLLDYPLGQDIKNIALDTVLSGVIPYRQDFADSLDQWLKVGGHIDIRRFLINWHPLLLIARGELLFNEKFAPNLRLTASARGLLELLTQLQDKKLIDGKGAFVAKILLENKAFTIDDNDKHLSVVTPIDWRDDTLSVEKITILKN